MSTRAVFLPIPIPNPKKNQPERSTVESKHFPEQSSPNCASRGTIFSPSQILPVSARRFFCPVICLKGAQGGIFSGQQVRTVQRCFCITTGHFRAARALLQRLLWYPELGVRRPKTGYSVHSQSGMKCAQNHAQDGFTGGDGFQNASNEIKNHLGLTCVGFGT